jgi:MFS family permease
MARISSIRSLIFYFTSETFLSLGIGMVAYAQPFFYKSTGFTDARVGVLFAVNSIASGCAALLLSPIADRIGASRVFKFATLLLGVAYIILGMTTSYGVWLFAAALSGVGGALLVSTENVVLGSLTKGREMAGVLSKFVALYMFLMGIGAVLAGVMAPHIGFGATIRVGAGIALVAPIIRWFVKAPDVRANRAFRWPSKRILWMSVYAIIFGIGGGLVSPFVTIILRDDFGMSSSGTALVYAASTFMISLGSFLVSWLLRHFRHGRTLVLAYAVGIVCTFLMALGAGSPFFAGNYLLRTVATSIPGPIVDATFLDLTNPTEYAQMFGVRVFGNSAGAAGGSYAGGLLLSHGWLASLFILSGIVFIIALAYLGLLLRRLSAAERAAELRRVGPGGMTG